MINDIINKFLHLFEYYRLKTNEKIVYLTFDDGPEPDITEFVLSQLQKYGFKGTFFCKGSNAKKYPHLLNQIVKQGHSIGNHTFSHLYGIETPCQTYVEDVNHANKYLHASLFRAPWGGKTFSQFLKLRKRYNMVHWSLDSGDTNDSSTIEAKFQNMVKHTKKGDIVLFHFCHEHETRTKKILPLYLEWMDKNGWKSKELK